MRAVKDSPVTRFERCFPLWVEKEVEKGMVRRLCAPPAPRVRTVKLCFLDVRSEEHHNHPPLSTKGWKGERGKGRSDEELISTARGTRTMKQCSFDTRSGGVP
jgi:hypothetical protein